jgi:4-hydroxy-tetrahydrodipicolinate reductase
MSVVAVSGAGGAMGRLVAETIAAAPDLELGSLYDPGLHGAEVAGRSVTADVAAVAAADVVVEFTRPDVVMANLEAWHGMGVHAVVGTSGFSAERIGEVEAIWGDGPPNCLIAPNFSIGAVLMMRFAEMAAPHFAASEVVELHHDRKADAPSGTALATAQRMVAAGGDQSRRTESEELVPGARGSDVDGVRVHAVRLPGLLAHQEVLFGSDGQTLSIRHDTSDRVSFMPGVLLAVRRVPDLPGVTIGLESLLGV